MKKDVFLNKGIRPKEMQVAGFNMTGYTFINKTIFGNLAYALTI